MVIGNYCSNKNCGHGYVNTLDGESEEMKNLKILGEIYVQYADHCLGKIIKEQYGEDNLATPPIKGKD